MDMGDNTSGVFSGNSSNAANISTYGETAEIFAKQIKDSISNRNSRYTILDIGSYKGELISNIKKLLPDYNLEFIGIDINCGAMESNETADIKIVADASHIPLEDGSVDFSIMRYVLQWNLSEKQKEIISEINRVTKNKILIEHVGSPENNITEWRKITDSIFSGKDFPELKREGCLLLHLKRNHINLILYYNPTGLLKNSALWRSFYLDYES